MMANRETIIEKFYWTEGTFTFTLPSGERPFVGDWEKDDGKLFRRLLKGAPDEDP